MSVQYKKQDPTEYIQVGDILMISPKTQLVTKAIRDRHGFNERFVVGVVTESDNTTLIPLNIDGGGSKDIQRALIDGGTSEINVVPILGGSSSNISREYVNATSCGVEIVRIDDWVHTGDRLMISRKTAGAAERMKISNMKPVGSRSIGKVVEKLENKEQVKVLLNIE